MSLRAPGASLIKESSKVKKPEAKPAKQQFFKTTSSRNPRASPLCLEKRKTTLVSKLEPKRLRSKPKPSKTVTKRKGVKKKRKMLTVNGREASIL
eukprot:UN18701